MDKYNAFLTVAELKSFTKAGIALGCTQSRVSRAIAEIEKECGVKLFERSSSAVVLTEEGTRLLPYAERLCGAYRELNQAISNMGTADKQRKLCLCSYIGGKQKYVNSYVNILNDYPHNTYVEVCGGMASVLLNKPRVQHEVYNDIDVTNALLFKALSDKRTAAQFIERVCDKHYDEALFDECEEIFSKYFVKNSTRLYDLKQGYSFEGMEGEALIETAMAVYCKRKFGWNGNLQSVYKEASARQIRTFERGKAQLPAIAERLEGVTVLNRDMCEVVAEYNRSNTAIFADPVYMEAFDNGLDVNLHTLGTAAAYGEGTPSYVHLLKLIATQSGEQEGSVFSGFIRLKGYFVLCGYRNPLTDFLLLRVSPDKAKWERRLIGAKHNLQSEEDNSKDKVNEYVYIYDPRK